MKDLTEQVTVVMKEAGFNNDAIKAVIATITWRADWSEDEWVPVNGFNLELNIYTDQEDGSKCASLWEVEESPDEVAYTVEHYIYKSK